MYLGKETHVPSTVSLLAICQVVILMSGTKVSQVGGVFPKGLHHSGWINSGIGLTFCIFLV
jgi:hypothetical protein